MNLLNKSKSLVSSQRLVLSLLTLTVLLTSCADNTQREIYSAPSNANKGIVNGSRIIKRNADKFASVLRLFIDGKGLCTGTYLGNGYVITAYHCVGLNHKLSGKDFPTIHLSSTAGLRTSRASKVEEIEVFVAPSEKDVIVGGHTVPMPDIVLLRFSGEFAKELEGVPAAKLGSKALAVDEKEIYIAGYGNDQFDQSVSAVGLLNLGIIKIVKVGEIIITSTYKEGDKYSAVLPGDSGGPLFKLDNNDLVLFGVASSVGYDRFEVSIEGTATDAESKHSRTDTDSVREWIECILSQG